MGLYFFKDLLDGKTPPRGLRIVESPFIETAQHTFSIIGVKLHFVQKSAVPLDQTTWRDKAQKVANTQNPREEKYYIILLYLLKTQKDDGPLSNRYTTTIREIRRYGFTFLFSRARFLNVRLVRRRKTNRAEASQHPFRRDLVLLR